MLMLLSFLHSSYFDLRCKQIGSHGENFAVILLCWC